MRGYRGSFRGLPPTVYTACSSWPWAPLVVSGWETEVPSSRVKRSFSPALSASDRICDRRSLQEDLVSITRNLGYRVRTCVFREFLCNEWITGPETVART